MFNKTQIGISSIHQCRVTISKNSYPWYCTDLCIFAVYSVKEIEKLIADEIERSISKYPIKAECIPSCGSRPVYVKYP